MKPDLSICEKCLKSRKYCRVSIRFQYWHWEMWNDRKALKNHKHCKKEWKILNGHHKALPMFINKDCPYYLEHLLLREK